MRVAVRVVSAAFLLCVSGCSYFGAPSVPYRPPGLAQAGGAPTGQKLFLRDCAWCHGNRGQGTTRGPDLTSGTNGAAFTDFEVRTGRMPLPAPTAADRRRRVFYTEAQIDEIVSYVASLGGPGPRVASPHPSAGDLALGLRLYQENCAACHSTTAVGGALTPGAGALRAGSLLVAPGLSNADPREVADAMSVGPGTMPVFDAFTPHEVDSIQAYVVSLNHPADRGGAAIGHVGPVAEGAVGWIVGLGLLVALCRLIGTRAGQHG